MATVNIHEAKTHFSKLVERAANGERVVIARAGKPVAMLGPIQQVVVREPGLLKGQINLSPEFDAELSQEWLDEFHSGPIDPV